MKHRGRLHQCTNTTWQFFYKEPISFFFFGIESPLEPRAERASKTADQISSIGPLLSSAVVNDSRPSSFPTIEAKRQSPTLTRVTRSHTGVCPTERLPFHVGLNVSYSNLSTPRAENSAAFGESPLSPVPCRAGPRRQLLPLLPCLRSSIMYM